MPIDSMALVFGPPRKVSRKPREGDLKITKQGIYRREPSVIDGCCHVNNGRVVYNWRWLRDTPPGHSAGKNRRRIVPVEEADAYLESLP